MEKRKVVSAFNRATTSGLILVLPECNCVTIEKCCKEIEMLCNLKMQFDPKGKWNIGESIVWFPPHFVTSLKINILS